MTDTTDNVSVSHIDRAREVVSSVKNLLTGFLQWLFKGINATLDENEKDQEKQT